MAPMKKEAQVKKAIVDEMRTKRGRSQADASAAVDDVFDAVKTVLERGESVSIQGFGTFSRKFQDERMGRNPRTGEAVKIQGRHKIKFTEPRQRTR